MKVTKARTIDHALLKKYLVKFTSESCAKISARFNWSIIIEQSIKTMSSFKLAAISFSPVFILYYSVSIVHEVTARCFSSFLSKTRKVWIKITYRLSCKRHWSCRKIEKLLAVSVFRSNKKEPIPRIIFHLSCL